MKKKIILIIIILTIIIYNILTIFIQNKVYAVIQGVSTDIENIDDTRYPGIKEKIKQLQSKYPNWKFKLLYTRLDWNDVITNEYTGHGTSPKNLVYKTSNYQGEWICSICGDKKYDNGSWRCTSEKAIKYMMDPRNSLNEEDIFQFEELTNVGCDINTLQNMTFYISPYQVSFLEKEYNLFQDPAIEPPVPLNHKQQHLMFHARHRLTPKNRIK